jgi:hypothetical protein
MNLFAVAGGVRGDLRGFGTCASGPLQIGPNLLAAWAGCVEILLRVALDLRCSAAAYSDFVTKLAKPVGQFRLMNRGGELLRLKQAPLLKSAELPVVTLGRIRAFPVII